MLKGFCVWPEIELLRASILHIGNGFLRRTFVIGAQVLKQSYVFTIRSSA
jgi:hypothetical protein